MGLHIKLPDGDPSTGYIVDLQLRHSPADSFVVKARPSGAAGLAEGSTRLAYVYGRGENSGATEDVHVTLRIAPEAVHAALALGDGTLTVTAEDMEGNPLDPAVLDCEAITLHPQPGKA